MNHIIPLVSQELRGRDSCMHACAQLPVSTHTVQDPLHREWCHLQWSGLLTSINHNSLQEMLTGQYDVDNLSLSLFSRDSRLCQVDNRTNYRTLFLCFEAGSHVALAGLELST